MARRNLNDRLLDMLEHDARLQLVGRPCALLWLRVVRAIAKYR